MLGIQSSNSSSPAPTLVLLIAAVIGGALLHTPLTSRRPAVADKTEYGGKEEKKVPTRLWQDPYQAIIDFDTLEDENLDLWRERSGSVLVFSVLINNLPYSEDVERRIRRRYAVLSALNATGYRPDNASHLSYFCYGNGRRIPFEWFKLDISSVNKKSNSTGGGNSIQKPESILVVWPPADLFNEKSLIKLRKFNNSIRKDLDNRPDIDIKIIGPPESTSFSQMAKEVLEVVEQRNAAVDLLEEYDNGSKMAKISYDEALSKFNILKDRLQVANIRYEEERKKTSERLVGLESIGNDLENARANLFEGVKEIKSRVEWFAKAIRYSLDFSLEMADDLKEKEIEIFKKLDKICYHEDSESNRIKSYMALTKVNAAAKRKNGEVEVECSYYKEELAKNNDDIIFLDSLFVNEFSDKHGLILDYMEKYLELKATVTPNGELGELALKDLEFILGGQKSREAVIDDIERIYIRAKRELSRDLEKVKKQCNKLIEIRGKIDYEKQIVENSHDELKEAEKCVDEANERKKSVSKRYNEYTNDNNSTLHIYSPFATADWKLLGSNPKYDGEIAENGWDSSWQNSIPPEFKIRFHFLIHSDTALSKTITEELSRRGFLKYKNELGHIVLVSEWDTFYGRLLPLSFKKVVTEHYEGLENKKSAIQFYGREFNLYPYLESQEFRELLTRNEISPDERVKTFSYLRGLDGKLPEKKREILLKEQLSNYPNEPRDINQQQKQTHAAGRHQIDYLQRIVSEIREHNDRIRQESNSKVRVIGILGSDVYDKLLISRALREHFPDVLFFTTDIDARLADPSEISFTQNMIVASSYGLKLNNLYQKDIAPFRYSYQTSIFTAILVALGEIKEKVVHKHQPRIFEIGKRDIINLTPGDASSHSLHPRRKDQLEGIGELSLETFQRKIWYSPTSLTLLFLFVLATFLGIREANQLDNLPRANFTIWFLMLFMLSLTVFIRLPAIVNQAYMNGEGEPWLFFEGVSIWPTEVIRLIGIFFALYFFILSVLKIIISNKKLTSEFSLTDQVFKRQIKEIVKDKKTKKNSRLWTLLISFSFLIYNLAGFFQIKLIKNWIGQKLGINNLKNDTHVRLLWYEYTRKGCSLKGIFSLLLTIAIFYVVIINPLDRMYTPPMIPFRGSYSDTIDFIITLSFHFCMVLLIFFVVNVALDCRKFITELTRQVYKWPEETRTKYLIPTPKINHFHPLRKFNSPDALDAWLSIRIIASRTELVGSLILFPFFILFLSIISRISYFDNWNWPISLIVTICAAFLMTAFCVINLQRSALNARGYVIDWLKAKLLFVMDADVGECDHSSPAYHKEIERLNYFINDIKTLKKGAFAPMTQNPVVVALLFPFGGVGSLVFVEQLLMLYTN